MDILAVLDGVTHQYNVASDSIVFGWVWRGLPLVQSDCRFFDRQYLWQKSIDHLRIHF